jgi:hypothetical protein
MIQAAEDQKESLDHRVSVNNVSMHSLGLQECIGIPPWERHELP